MSEGAKGVNAWQSAIHSFRHSLIRQFHSLIHSFTNSLN